MDVILRSKKNSEVAQEDFVFRTTFRYDDNGVKHLAMSAMDNEGNIDSKNEAIILENGELAHISHKDVLISTALDDNFTVADDSLAPSIALKNALEQTNPDSIPDMRADVEETFDLGFRLYGQYILSTSYALGKSFNLDSITLDNGKLNLYFIAGSDKEQEILDNKINKITFLYDHFKIEDDKDVVEFLKDILSKN